LGKYSIIFETG